MGAYISKCFWCAYKQNSLIHSFDKMPAGAPDEEDYDYTNYVAPVRESATVRFARLSGSAVTDLTGFECSICCGDDSTTPCWALGCGHRTDHDAGTTAL